MSQKNSAHILPKNNRYKIPHNQRFEQRKNYEALCQSR